ncbi:hypothetical protein DM01DRAFT_1339169 [Hesseltinella vesiculosa]|uniref:SEC7 domain-containing protein n=1 Tax=Hesseltinella vesiculosa TaxID=101127 RepID=A0A1X2G7M6_9FUNG|nr:hypothetical protein DM01DRAFT_1339169 [Hesseltinella vesiculosa]
MAGPGPEANTETNESSFSTQLAQYDFKDDAIDTALRKLLAKVSLPKEAQQIDRAMEDFAKHYHACNPRLADGPDPIYAVAFSILLLHTDAHNKNVKRKMTKDTFIMRTRVIEGGETVASEILDVMYDNIVASEFTRFDQDLPTHQDKSLSWFKKTPEDFLQDLYPRLDKLMAATNPYTFKLTAKHSVLPLTTIHACIDSAMPLALAGVRTRQQDASSASSAYSTRVYKAGILDRKYDLGLGGKRTTTRSWRPCGIILNGSQLMFFGDLGTFQTWLDDSYQQRLQALDLSDPTKDDDGDFEGSQGSRLSHPTTPDSLVSTLSSPTSPQPPPVAVSQFPSGSTSSSSLVSPTTSSIAPSTTVTLSSSTSLTTSSPAMSMSSPPSSLQLRPVQIVSLQDAICLYDESYQKYPHVFRLMTSDGQQFLLHGESMEQVDDWVQKINYVAAVKTTGVRFSRPSQWQPKREAKAKAKILALSEAWMEVQRRLDKENQLRHQLLVQLPLQKATKDRIMQFAEHVGQRLTRLQIRVRRFECYREIIERELVVYHQQLQHPQHPSASASATPSHSRLLPQRYHPVRKFSAPLPFYANLHPMALASSTDPVSSSSPSSPASPSQDTDPASSTDDNPSPSIPDRSSSLMVGPFPFTPSTSSSTPPSSHNSSMPAQESAPPKRDEDEGFIIVTPRILEIQRRRRSQSNPDSPKSPAGSLLQDDNDDDDDGDDINYPLLLPNKQRLHSESATADDDR